MDRLMPWLRRWVRPVEWVMTPFDAVYFWLADMERKWKQR